MPQIDSDPTLKPGVLSIPCLIFQKTMMRGHPHDLTTKVSNLRGSKDFFPRFFIKPPIA